MGQYTELLRLCGQGKSEHYVSVRGLCSECAKMEDEEVKVEEACPLKSIFQKEGGIVRVCQSWISSSSVTKPLLNRKSIMSLPCPQAAFNRVSRSGKGFSSKADTNQDMTMDFILVC